MVGVPLSFRPVTIPPLVAEQEAHAAIMAGRRRAADLSEPGSGKTLTALRACELAGYGRDVTGRIVVVAPPIALKMWGDVAASYFKHSDVSVVYGKGKVVGVQPRDAAILVVSHAQLNKLSVAPYGATVIDEAHAFKSLDAARTKLLYGRRAVQGSGGLVDQSRHAFALTGTPAPRYLDDVFPMLKALAPEVLDYHGVSSYDAFVKQFCYTQLRSYHPRQRPKLVVMGNRNDGIAQLRKMLFEPIPTRDLPFAVRRTVASMIGALPPLLVNDWTIDYEDTTELADITAKAAHARMLDDTSGETAAMRRLLGIAKARPAAEALVAIADHHGNTPVLAFLWHKEVSAQVKAEIERLQPGARVVIIDGSTPMAVKQAVEAAFNAGEIDYLLGNIATMGVSLNLQAGGHVAAFIEHDWSKDKHEQAWKRLHRLGQTNPVHLYNLYAEHIADDAAASVAERKAADIDKLLGRNAK